MTNWQTASEYELKQYEAISSFLNGRKQLLRYLFHNREPRLNSSPKQIISGARGFCTSDKILIRVALQLWCEYGQIGLQELFYLDGEVFLKVLRALESLGPKPSSLYNLLNLEVKTCG